MADAGRDAGDEHGRGHDKLLAWGAILESAAFDVSTDNIQCDHCQHLIAMSKASSPSKQRYHHGHLRSALLEAAGEILDHAGAGELSLRETAKIAGVSAAAPYRHFASKEALLVALAEDGVRSEEHTS